MSDDETQFKIMNEKDDFSKERARGNTFSNYPRPYFKSVFSHPIQAKTHLFTFTGVCSFFPGG